MTAYAAIQNRMEWNFKTRGPRGPWNAHLRVKIFKSFIFFIALYTTGDTWGSKSEVMFKKEFSKI